jgi:phage terminase small subunit
LTENDRHGLASYAEACVAHQRASRQLDEAMRNSAFLDAKSNIAKLGRLALQAVDEAAETMFHWSDRLGLSPLARSRLGIRLEDRPPSRDDWPEELRLDSLRRLHRREDEPA